MGQPAAKTQAPSAATVTAPASRAAEPAAASTASEPSFSGGSPLVPSTRTRMESAFGRSFEGVRVHTDARAASFANDHQAEAVTTGQDIAFGHSRYRPGTEGGDRLLAHELAHVVQQGGVAHGPPRAKSEVSTPNEPAEMQADAAAGRVMSGQPASVTEGGYAWSTRNRLMRKALSGAGAPSPTVAVPTPQHAAETASPTEAKPANDTTSVGPEVTGGPPAKKRKKPEEAAFEDKAAAKGAAPSAEKAAATGAVAGAEKSTATGTVAGAEKAAATGTVTGAEKAAATGTVAGGGKEALAKDVAGPDAAKREGESGAAGVAKGREPRGGTLVGKLVAQSLRAKDAAAADKPGLSVGAKEALREGAEPDRKPEDAGAKTGAAGAKADVAQAKEPATTDGKAAAAPVDLAAKPGEAKGPSEGEGAAAKKTNEPVGAPGQPVEGAPGKDQKGKAEAGAPGKEQKAGEKGKDEKAKGDKASPEGEAPGAAAEGAGPGAKNEKLAGAQKLPTPEQLAGEKGAGGEKAKGGDPGAEAAGEANAKQGVSGEAQKGLEGANEKGPAQATPAAAEREPAGGAGGGGGGGGGGASAGGGEDGGGGEGGGSPEAQATEDKVEEKKPDEEKQAEAQQDQEQAAAEGGGGGGEGGEAAEGGGGGGGGGAEPEADAGGGGGGGGGGAESPSAEAAAPEAAAPEGAAPEAASAEAAGGGDGAGPAAEAPAEAPAPEPASDEAQAPKTPAEEKVHAEQAPAVAEAKQDATEQKQSEEEQAHDEEQPPEAAGPEEGQLSPAEKDTASASVSEDAGGGGAPAGGGGGGGGAIAEKPAPAAPDVSASEPKAAMGSLKGQAPMAIQGALGGVNKAVSKSVGDRKDELAANPPTRAASSGMPGKNGPTQLDKEGGDNGGEKAEKVEEGPAVETPAPEATPDAPPPAVSNVSAPATSGGGEGEMSEQDADRMGSAIEEMPTTDPEVSTSAGPPPTVALEGNADPAQVTAQRAKMDKSITAAHEEGKADVQKPMGENEIAPQATDETLTAKVPGGGGGAGGAAPGGEGGGADQETASIIAHEKSQGEIDSAVDKGQSDMAAEEAKEQESSDAEKKRTEEEAAKAESDAAAEQESEKASAQSEVAKQRGDWSDEQQAAVDKSNTDADDKQKEADEKVETEKTQADEGADREISSGEQKAEREKEAGEQKADREKEKGKEESSGFFGWLASKAKALFNKIKEAVKAVMKALREAVKAVIEAAKKAAVAIIEKARQAIVAAIRAAGDFLIAISDVALAAFPELKAKFQSAVRQTVQDAEDTVNKIADGLKKAVTALLDALGDFLDKALGLLEKALLAAVDFVATVVDKVIKAAEAIAKVFGTFIVLIKDIAAGPGQWISNLGSSVVDGVKNHLVKAMKSAISEWFKSKVEEVLGIPIDLMKALFKGGFNLSMIGKMAWEALKTAIPGILIQLLIEKLVAMVVPAAGAVMAIIEGVQAAWGAISRIIAAIDAFLTFLKAVKGGNAGPQFATAVAAGAVAVIDFVANWLLKRLMKPAKKVSGKLAAIAKKILAKIKKALKKVGKKLKKFFKKVGKKLGKLKEKIFGKKKGKKKDKKKKDKDKDKAKKKQERLDKAVDAIKPALSSTLSGGIGKLILKAKLLYWRLRYRLSRLALLPDGTVEATVNPKKPVLTTKQLENIGAKLEPILVAVEEQFLAEWDEDRPDEDQEAFDDAVDALGKGKKREALGLNPFDQILLLRGIENGSIKVKKQRGKSKPNIIPGEGDYSVTLKNKGNLNEFVEPGLSTYEKMLAQFKKDPEGFFDKKGDRLKGLVGGIETARAPGMLPTSQVSKGLVDAGVLSQSDSLLKHPLATEKSSIAAEPLRGKEGKKRSKAEKKKIDAATSFRHQRIAQIFVSLRQVLKGKKKTDLLAGDDQSKALARLAESFDKWLKAAFPIGKHKKSDAKKVAAALRSLKARLLVFMRTFR
ncbi:MAG: DUF4157 domain-containing protein [Polyangiaceae bacterium]